MHPTFQRMLWLAGQSITGTPKQVAEKLQGYVDIGATCAIVIDMMRSLLGREEQEAAQQRSIEVCRILKAG